MKRLISKFIFLLLIVIAVDQVGGRMLGRICHSTEKGDYGRNNYILTQANEDILIFGSSRCIHHYDPDIISDNLGMSCYNCGEDGMGIILMLARLRMVMSRHTPRLVIYDISPSYDLEQGDNTRFLGFIRPYYDNPVIGEICRDIEPSERFKNMSHLYRFNSRFIDIVAQRYSSFAGTARNYKWSPLSGEIRKYAPNYEDESELPDTVKLRYLQQLADICRTHDIDLVFSVSPTLGVTDDSRLAPIKELAARNGILLLNHYCDTAFIEHPELFHDRLHLNVEGARLLTHTVTDEIKTIAQDTLKQ